MRNACVRFVASTRTAVADAGWVEVQVAINDQR